MTDRANPPADPRPALVVVTTVKPDGRKIHYYEWPERPAKPPKEAKVKPARARRPRV